MVSLASFQQKNYTLPIQSRYLTVLKVLLHHHLALCPILDKKKNFAPFFWGAISSILNQGQTRLEATGGPRGASQPL